MKSPYKIAFWDVFWGGAPWGCGANARRLNWLPTEPRRSLMPGASMSFLFSLERKAAKRLAMHAASNAQTEKSSSLSDASETPPMIGTARRATRRGAKGHARA